MKKYIRALLFLIKGNSFKNEYQHINQIKNEKDLLEFQNEHLTKIILHAYYNVPYYHRIFDSIGLVTNDIVRLEKFNKIPILTKDNLRTHYNDLLSKDYLKRKWYQNSSGGSTGEPTRFIQDKNYMKWYMASNDYYYQKILDVDEKNVKKIYLWGSPRDLFKGNIGIKNNFTNWLTNTVILNSFTMNENKIKSYTGTINLYKPVIIRGYADSLYTIASFCNKNKIKIHSPTRIISSAETLTPDMRKTIESTFETKVYDFYGSRETASIAGECKEGNIHIFSYNNYIEILDQNGNPSLENQDGRIIITNLHNYSMPLIRYEIGDTATNGPKKCKCGHFLPCLKKISGRLEEQFIKKDGSIVIGYFFVHLIGVLQNKGYIKKFQVIQEDYNRIRIRMILEKGLPNIEKQEIEKKIQFQMGSDCQIIWENVDMFQDTASGKFFYTKSYVKRN